MKRDEFKHLYPLAVRWGDMDALGHVNNVELLRYIECGRVAYCADVLSLSFGPQQRQGWILAELQCTFHKQAHYPQALNVTTRCCRLGTRSCELLAAIFPEQIDEPILTSRAVLVWFDFERQSSLAVPETVRTAIRTYETVTPEERKPVP